MGNVMDAEAGLLRRFVPSFAHICLKARCCTFYLSPARCSEYTSSVVNLTIIRLAAFIGINLNLSRSAHVKPLACSMLAPFFRVQV